MSSSASSPDEPEAPLAPTGEKKLTEARREGIWVNTGAIIAMRLMGMGLRSVSWFMLSRYLGAEGVGVWGLLTTTVELFRGLGSFGVDVLAVRELSMNSDRQPQVMGLVIGQKILLTLAAMVVLLGFAWFRPELAQHYELLLLLALGMVPQVVTSGLITRFQATHSMGRLIPLQGLTGLANIGAVVAIIRLDLGIVAFLWTTLTLDIVSLVFVVVMTRLTFGPVMDFSEAVPGPPMARLFKQAFPLGILELLVLAYSRLNVLFLANFGGMSAVGLYTQAVQLTSPVLMVANALATSAFPVLARLVKSRDHNALRDLFGAYTIRSMALNAVLATAVSFAARPILEFIKPEFGDATGAVAALAWATLCMFQNNLSSVVLHSFGKSHWVTGCAILNLITFLTASPILVSQMGPTGGGLATLLVEGINMVVQLILVRFLLWSYRAEGVVQS